MRVFLLLMFILMGVLLGTVLAQAPTTPPCQALLQEQAKERLVDEVQTVTFYRIVMDSGAGDWHLFNAADTRYVNNCQAKIKSGEWQNTRLEFFSTQLKERLPR